MSITASCVLWDELDPHEPIISCTHGHYKCNIGQAHEKQQDDNQLNQF